MTILSHDEEQEVNKNPMRSMRFEDLWNEGILMAGREDVKVLDA